MKFKPDRNQLTLKLRIHRVVSPLVLARISGASIGLLNPYLGSIDVNLFTAWCREPGFIEYLLSPDDVDIELYEARESAKNVVIDIVKGDFADSKKAAVQLKAAEMLLNRERESSIKNLSQKLSISGSGNMKQLEKKSTVELTEELKRLQAANRES